ncbi:MAG: AsmA family protein [Desulfonatronovibrio sp. MSAO_Bac4]|nr:MAG: AsmA family protein [Desulfonatronovibrio sp. MSAO_Bac4]
MAKILKITLSLVGILIILIIAAAIILPMVIDINDYKDRISQEIKKNTGYEVVIEDDIELSIVPWIGLSLGRTYVANPPEFGPEPMAALDELQVRIKVLPLFSGQIEAQKIVLHGFHLALIKDEQGQTNWEVKEDSAREEPGRQEGSPAPEADTHDNESFAVPQLNIEGLEIARANISYQDRQNNQTVHLTNFNLETDKITLDNPFNVKASMDLDVSEPELDGKFQMETTTAIDLENKRVTLAPFALDLNMDGAMLSNPIKDGKISGNLTYDGALHSLNITDLVMDLYEAKINMNIAASNLDQIPDINFQLKGDNIDLDKIIATHDSTDSESPYRNDNTSQNQSATSSKNADRPSTPEPIELGFLRDFNINGQADINDFRASGIIIDSIEAEITSGNGQMKISPLNLSLYEGTNEMEILLNDAGNRLNLNISQNLEGLQIGPFIRDISQKDILTGTARINSQLKTSGTHGDQLISNLAGNAEAFVSEGVIKGIDLERMIRQVFALASGQGGTPSQEGGETRFTRLGGTFNIDQGIAVSRDLAMHSPVLGLKGDLSADLPKSHLDSRSQISLDGALKEELASMYNLKDVNIPLRVRGPFDDLSFRLDSETIIKSFVQQKGEEVLGEILDRVVPSDDENNDSGSVEGILRRLVPSR